MCDKWLRTSAALGGLLLCTGCPFADSRTTNQGGGTLVSAVDKIATQELASLTPDEVQLLTDAFTNLQDQVTIDVSDEQAGDAVLFLIEHELNSFEEIQQFVAEAQQNPDAVQVPESLLRLVESIEVNGLPPA
jgi:hypothetical protein